MKKILILAAISVLLLAQTVFSNPLTVMTEEYPPFNYMENGKLKGLSSEVTAEIMKRVGLKNDIKLLPWSRAYNLIKEKDGYVLFSMTRTKERENLFKWVGPVTPNTWVFFAKKGSNIKINSLKDAMKVGKIGTYKDDAAEVYLLQNGFKNTKSVVQDILNVKLLLAGRIDLWITGELQGYHKAKSVGYKTSDIKKVFEVQKTELYIAFSKGTPDSVVKKWQKALDDMKKDGSYKKIFKKYM